MQNSETEWEARSEDRDLDRTGWAVGGLWDDEPDRIEWRYHGTPRFPLLIVRSPTSGALCGYVGVPPGHPHHGVDWESLEGELDVSAHGGITYANVCNEQGRICHGARKGEAGEVWWLGFDCSHAFDVCPMLEGLFPWARSGLFMHLRPSYKSVAFVRAEVERLAEQLSRVAKGTLARKEREKETP